MKKRILNSKKMKMLKAFKVMSKIRNFYSKKVNSLKIITKKLKRKTKLKERSEIVVNFEKWRKSTDLEIVKRNSFKNLSFL